MKIWRSISSKTTIPLTIITSLVLLECCSSPEEFPAADYPVTPVDFTQVSLQEGFWKDWVETTGEVTIPFAFRKCEETGRIHNFQVAAGMKEGRFRGRFGFNDSDLYKIMEGAAYTLSLKEDRELEAYLDSLVSYVAGAQEEDGYLYTAWTLKANEYNDFACCSYHEEGQWIGTSGDSHEFYNAGHMYEAAVAHYLATGKSSFLDVAIRNADLIYDVCMNQGNDYVPGHQEIEIGLARLYRITGERRYLDLARHLLDIRADARGGEYAQAHMKVTEQSEAVGHAVRANYMYSAMADIAALTGDASYLDAVGRIWENVAGKKLSITGGVGASHRGEAYGVNYALPNHPYNETCAAIANVYWNHRMFLLHGDAKYMDVLERALYNGVISGLSLEGTLFFYPNTLQHDGLDPFNQGVNGRSPWFDCSCCPSNLSRFIPSVGGYAYAVRGEDLYVNLFMNSRMTIGPEENEFGITQRSDYPWDGRISLEIESGGSVERTIHIRIPGWSLNQPVPSDLFTFPGNPAEEPSLQVNGAYVDLQPDKGYASIRRKWEKGDLIILYLPMEARMVKAHEKVKDKTNRAAVQYGPVVYCAEEIDNEVDVVESPLAWSSRFDATYMPELLGGVNMLSGNGLCLVPYFSWANRGAGKMNVWFNVN